MNPFLPIRIIATKIGRNHEILNYVNALTKEVCKQEGFIETSKFWKICDDPTIVTITDWESKLAWHRWLHSHERVEILKNYSSVVENEKHDILMKKKDNNDIFLL